jgi:hypothetical protein
MTPLNFVQSIRSVPAEQARGGLDYLAAISPTVRGLSLEMTHRLADAITETTVDPDPHLAKVQAVALAWVYQTIIDESGRRRVAGQRSPQIAAALRPIIESILNGLDEWLSPKVRGAHPRRRAAVHRN